MAEIIDVNATIQDAVSVYNEEVITAADFKKLVEEIMNVVKTCSIKDLKNMFIKAMDARGAKQDMSQFEPINCTYVDLFIRQIQNTVMMFAYDDLVAFHEYVMSLSEKVKKTEER